MYYFDTKVLIDERTVEAKRLRNNPIKTFMCSDCKSRLDTHLDNDQMKIKFNLHFPNENL